MVAGVGRTERRPAAEELRQVRRIRWRTLLVVLVLVVAIELVSSFAWSRYDGPALLRSRSAGSPAVTSQRS